MSFQGDVAGIGLGELLQGLARGGREGVLTLRGGSLGSTVGLSAGQIHLLPEPEEDPETWRKRCERAWVKDPNHRIDTLRMGEIAFAARLEQLFELLDCQGVHFRFEPGPTPGVEPAAEPAGEERPLGRMETGGTLDASIPVLCQPISVEYLLLEYARLSDECAAHGDATQLSNHTVPCLIVDEAPTPELERLWGECDGTSSVLEIADRMGWPLRQAKATLVDLVVKGYVREADGRGLLELARGEIGRNHFARAASRLSGWCEVSAPGPQQAGDVELLLEEWAQGKLPVVLASMDARTGRTLLRRIDLGDPDIAAALERWNELKKYQRHDALTDLRLLSWRLKSDSEADAPQVGELLKLARRFQDMGWSLRAGVILHAAAQRMPETTSVRLEVGLRLLAVGHTDEGAHWVLEACRTLIDSDLSEKALNPLHNLLEAEPTHREARQLMAIARTKCSEGKKTRRNSLIVLATVLLVSAVALVKVRVDLGQDRRLAAVSEMIDRPELALALLDENFPEDDSERVAILRDTLLARISAENKRQRDAWLTVYEEIKQECTTGDEREGLRLALALPRPPELSGEEYDWPTAGRLLDALAARLEQTFAQAASKTGELEELPSPESLNDEKRFENLVKELDASAGQAEHNYLIEAFQQRMAALRSSITERNEVRAEAFKKLESELQDQELDRLLRLARVHAQAGDIERAVDYYRQLFDSPGSQKIRDVLRAEKEAAQTHLAALEDARGLARQGRHDEAERRLLEVCKHTSEHFLPWKVESQPSGVRARLGDGSVRVTPFTVESAIGEHIQITFEQDGYERVTVLVERPGDVMARLSKRPQRWWRSDSRVSALPIAVGSEHIVANRGGEIARLAESGAVRWQHRLASLGGIARTPVLLPGLKGTLLVLTEDGIAWLIEVDTGRAEGPWKLGSPPELGPRYTSRGVEATFVDGRTAIWSTKLAPQILSPEDEDGGVRRTSVEEASARAGTSQPNSNLRVLRRTADGDIRLEAPEGAWSVEVGPTHYLVRNAQDPEQDFSVELVGEWAFLAWEAPDAKWSAGRLWISDDAGLRGYEP